LYNSRYLKITDDPVSGQFEMALAGAHVTEAASAQLNAIQ